MSFLVKGMFFASASHGIKLVMFFFHDSLKCVFHACVCLLVKSDDVFVVVICWSVCGVWVFKVSFDFLVGAFSCINMNFVRRF